MGLEGLGKTQLHVQKEYFLLRGFQKARKAQ
jgi:hypothetical protein